MQPTYLPKKEGLYDPEFEHDACGVGFVAHLKGEKSHYIVSKGVELLINLEHRGAVGAEKNSGDGAGILTQMPDKFMRKIAKEQGFELPEFGHYGVGVVYIPRDLNAGIECQSIVTNVVEELGLEVLGWRKVPTNNYSLGEKVKSVEPYVYHVFIQRPEGLEDAQAFERKMYVARKHSQTMVTKSQIIGTEYFYMPSMSYKTISYKGQLTTEQLPQYFSDLADDDFESAIALVHSRFSTNTFPSWPLAQPFRYLAHNGEINTLRGNINWMRARQSMLKSKLFTDDELDKIYPYLINEQKGSDSSVLDNVVELLTLAGRELPHVMMMMIPAAWKDEEMDADLKAFYEYHATFMEPWDGPASVAFTDGKFIGATLDRNGLRPSRYSLTKDNILVMASEQGALEFPSEDIVLKGRLQPGKMFLADLEEGRIISDEEIKTKFSKAFAYADWVDTHKINIDDLPLNNEVKQPNHNTILQRQKCYGYSQEDLKMILAPMANEAYEATGSMGNDAALSVLSNHSLNLYNYFHQLFAQVTNPPIDPIREESVMSLTSYIGPQGNLFQRVDEDRKFIKLTSPILTNTQLEKLRGVTELNFKAKTFKILFDAKKKGAMEIALDALIQEVEEAVNSDYQVIILSTRGIGKSKAPIPALLATSAVHQHLVKKGIRTNCGLVIETAEAREIHHFATLIGYGANAINPYLAFETIEDMRKRDLINEGVTHDQAVANYIKAIGKGIHKVMSKMGISTIRSYTGAQIFEALGLSSELVDKYFTGTPTRIEGMTIDAIEEETLICHGVAYPKDNPEANDLGVGGQYAYRQRGENHLFSPEVIFLLQQSTKTNNYETYKQYAKLINECGENYITLRSLLDFTKQKPIDISEVESVESIITRFATGAEAGIKDDTLIAFDVDYQLSSSIKMHAEIAQSNSSEGNYKNKTAEIVEFEKQIDELEARIYYRRQADGFGLGSEGSSSSVESGTKKIGAEVQYKISNKTRVNGEIYQQDNLSNANKKQVAKIGLQHQYKRFEGALGLRHSKEELSGKTIDNNVVLIGGKYTTNNGKVTLRGNIETSFDNNNGSETSPDRAILGMDLKLDHDLSLFLEHEVTNNESVTTQNNRIGISKSLWKGAKAKTTYTQETSSLGQKNYATLGLQQRINVTETIRADISIDHAKTLEGTQQKFNVNQPNISGSQRDDYTAFSVGLGESHNGLSWTSRFELREGDLEDKMNLSLSIIRHLKNGKQLSGKFSYLNSEHSNGDNKQMTKLSFGTAWHPSYEDFVVFSRLDLIDEQSTLVTASDTHTQKIIHNIHYNRKIAKKTQVSLHHGVKHIIDRNKQRKHHSTIDTGTVEIRRDISEKWDIGLRAGYLHDWENKTTETVAGISIGMTPAKNAWLELGYNFEGFDDDDFDRNNYKRKGVFLTFSYKFNQDSLRKKAFPIKAKSEITRKSKKPRS